MRLASVSSNGKAPGGKSIIGKKKSRPKCDQHLKRQGGKNPKVTASIVYEQEEKSNEI